jgi:hypothetical protein
MEKYVRNATTGNQLLSVTDVEKYFAANAKFLRYGATDAAMQIRKLSAKLAIMIRKLIHGEHNRIGNLVYLLFKK